ncbi:MAG: hypothetical protein EPO20_15085 [Betaproteobacteria bacterium]|nr:MAG: hypothetical protein EPO20_15085 [Betaproteobacteria bacterium]
MEQDEIIAKSEMLLRRHQSLFPSASLSQEPHIGDVFSLFAAAFNGGLVKRGCLSADALFNKLHVRIPGVFEQPAGRELYDLWSAWTYAWQHARLLTCEPPAPPYRGRPKLRSVPFTARSGL